ncbi:hypothetical protein [Paenibacillus sp. FSL E2-0178]|uniref:hypothetical protein n=1 Tax=Paenibacillus sp. FSL E2-0178 TaxID=2921361 RepID=UPI003159234E
MDFSLKQMAVAVYKKEVPATNFSLSDMEGALRDKFRELAPDYNTYRRNQLDIFELVQEVIDEVAPKKIEAAIGYFAQVKSYTQGERPRFRLKKGRNNVKRFITRIGLGGVLQRVRLDQDFVEVATHALGGAGYVEFEQFLDGQMDWTDLINLIIDGIESEIYKEIQAALIASYSKLPASNKAVSATFDSAEMSKLITTVTAYGDKAAIICTPEFAANIVPDAKFIGDADRQDMRNQGYIGRFLGADVIVLPQSFADSANTTKIFDPQYAVVVPVGSAPEDKIVKVVLEGQTIVDEVKNADGSKEFSAYKKVGTAVLSTNYFAMYRLTGLS